MSLRQSVTYACRSLLRAPLFSAAVVATLTIGIGAAAAIFAVINAVLLQPLAYRDPERLVGAWHDMPALSLTHAQQTSATYRTYRTFARTIEGIAGYHDGSLSIGDPDGRAEPARMDVTWATANLVSVLGVHPLVGRW